jgi:hypothetical protein
VNAWASDSGGSRTHLSVSASEGHGPSRGLDWQPQQRKCGWHHSKVQHRQSCICVCLAARPSDELFRHGTLDPSAETCPPHVEVTDYQQHASLSQPRARKHGRGTHCIVSSHTRAHQWYALRRCASHRFIARKRAHGRTAPQMIIACAHQWHARLRHGIAECHRSHTRGSGMHGSISSHTHTRARTHTHTHTHIRTTLTRHRIGPSLAQIAHPWHSR